MSELKDTIQKGFPDSIHFPRELELLCEWCDVNGYPISGCFELRADDCKAIYYWFRSHAADDHLAQFGAGADGSLYCIWKQQDGREPIVHMGSEGDALMVLAGSMTDFIRLLAVGYEEIGFENLSAPPEEDSGINPHFQKWVAETFSVSIPATGSEIVEPAGRDHDDFKAFVDSVVAGPRES
ncbi:MAG: hypothetical protein ACIAXF_15170 [Phycisphaerales bacterium JB063]